MSTTSASSLSVVSCRPRYSNRISVFTAALRGSSSNLRLAGLRLWQLAGGCTCYTIRRTQRRRSWRDGSLPRSRKKRRIGQLGKITVISGWVGLSLCVCLPCSLQGDSNEGGKLPTDTNLHNKLFDAQLACFFGLPAQYPMEDIAAPLPIPIPDPSNLGSPFGQVMANLLDRGQLPEQPSDMGLTCVAFALYR